MNGGGGGGGGEFQDPPTQNLGKPKDPELSHPHGGGGGWTPTHPPTHPATHSAKSKKRQNFPCGAFGADPITPKMAHPHGRWGGSVDTHPPRISQTPTHPPPRPVGRTLSKTLGGPHRLYMF